MSLFNELKRRNVFRVGLAYVVSAWIIAQVASLVLDSIKAPDWVMQAILLVLGLGFIIALVISWAYELTPVGLKKDSDVSRDASVANHTAKKLDYITLAGVLLVVALFIYQQSNTPTTNLIPQEQLTTLTEGKIKQTNTSSETGPLDSVSYNSIAVLPFADLSPQNNQAYFSDGIAEEILNVLVKVKTLKVASRTSSFGFKGQESLGIPKIAEKLKVRHILEGSVRKSGETVRVTAQLIDADTDQHLWSETYDRELTTENLFAIQDEVAKAIVKQLGITLNADQQPNHENHYLPNVDSYELFLKARALYRSRIELDAADADLIQLLVQDPGYAPAWELRAAITSLLKDYGFSQATDEVLLAQVEEYAAKALAINPNSALAIASKANMMQNISWDTKQYQNQHQIIVDLKKATELEPNLPSPMNWLGMVYADRGNIDLATETLRICQQKHPFFAPCVENLFDVLVSAGQVDQAWDVFNQASEQGITTGYWVNYLLLAEKKERIAFLLILSGRDLFLGYRNVGQIYDAFQNLDDDHSELLKNIMAFAHNKKSFNWTYIASLLIPLGAHELTPFGPVMWGPDHKKYRQSLEFKHHMKSTGIFEYWQQHGFPPQCKPIGDDDFKCE